ncbi:MAG TPA: hypothetical protein VFA67_12320, partial [Candidatus Sulfotelmatobacter sp.]|nr:hypothetical protein [Candidatus Sulfotelmatobacter sp.]
DGKHHARSVLDWLLVLGTSALFVALASVARLPVMDISRGWGVVLSGAMIVLLASGGVALWRTTRFR